MLKEEEALYHALDLVNINNNSEWSGTIEKIGHSIEIGRVFISTNLMIKIIYCTLLITNLINFKILRKLCSKYLLDQRDLI